MKKIKKIIGFVIIIIIFAIWIFTNFEQKQANILIKNINNYENKYEFNYFIKNINKIKLAKIEKKYKITSQWFWEIIERKIEYLEKNKVKVIFLASTKKWDSLHEFIYLFTLKNWTIVKVEKLKK